MSVDCVSSTRCLNVGQEFHTYVVISIIFYRKKSSAKSPRVLIKLERPVVRNFPGNWNSMTALLHLVDFGASDKMRALTWLNDEEVGIGKCDINCYLWYTTFLYVYLSLYVYHLRLSLYLFKKNGTLYFWNTIKTIDHIDLILSGINIHPWPHVSCKFGNDIQRNKVKATILVKDTKLGRI